jgi:hypothetical protein
MRYTYFAARSDTAATTVLRRPPDPGRPAATDDAAGLLSEIVDGVGFTVELDRFAELLTGEKLDLEDGEHWVAATPDERSVIYRVPPDLVRTIANTDVERLHSLIPQWAEFPYLADPNPARLTTFATDLHRLSGTATAAAGGVYSHAHT